MRYLRSKDILAGFIYVAIAVGALWIATEYKVGRAGRMGPGYFPNAIAGGLLVLGILSIGRGMLRPGEAAGHLAIKPLALITIALAAFGLLLHRAGFVIALPALLVISAAASQHFRFEPKIAAGLVAFAALCVVVFVKLLGLPMPLLGSWFV